MVTVVIGYVFSDRTQSPVEERDTVSGPTKESTATDEPIVAPVVSNPSNVVPGPGSGSAPSAAVADADESLHPYAEYSADTLEVMAYNDAEAARLLGLTTYEQDPAQAFQWTLRAAALAGDNEALISFANTFAPPIRIGDQAVLQNYRESYIIAVVADAVGPTNDNEDRMDPLMREAFPNPDEIMQRLRPIADAHIRRMREIQRDVTGTITIAEPEPLR